ncbi:hypothetical protein EVAR_87624_1 [Eumeta japonica]|uniref:Uncharacterized protein n=1 Tax=Eumeta variegata TaxID=151549 RepID=A0A4C1WLN2_EUMVA|nr:hypothetical protein EVAR_87624_1 [Eumeta japonica]
MRIQSPLYEFVTGYANYTYGEPIPYRFSSDAYVAKLLVPLRNVAQHIHNISFYPEPAKKFTGRGHLACLHYSGNKAFSNRKPLYSSWSVRDDVNLLSFYAKNRLAAAGLAVEQATGTAAPRSGRFLASPARRSGLIATRSVGRRAGTPHGGAVRVAPAAAARAGPRPRPRRAPSRDLSRALFYIAFFNSTFNIHFIDRNERAARECSRGDAPRDGRAPPRACEGARRLAAPTTTHD